MKKLLSIILAVIMIATAVPMTFAVDCTHQNEVTAEAECAICSAEDTVADEPSDEPSEEVKDNGKVTIAEIVEIFKKLFSIIEDFFKAIFG